jgi:hypothetical protein
LVVAGFVKMYDTALLNIGDTRDFFAILLNHQWINPRNQCYSKY